MTPEENWMRCVSCRGVYDKGQPAGYYHQCPPGTDMPRDENLDDSDPKNVKVKAGGKGALKASKPAEVVIP